MELFGRVTADSKVTELKNGRKVVNFSIAINDSYKPKDSEQPVKITTYVNCSYWISEVIAKHLVKGAQVELYGRISVNAWTNAEGDAKASLNFHVNSIKLHGKGKFMETNTNNMNPKAKTPADDLPF